MLEKEETAEILESLERKQKIRKLLVIAIISFFLIIVIFLLISAYFYFKSPEKTLGIGANIESALLSPDGTISYIKLVGGSDKNITKIKFIFTDENGNEQVYETSEGIKEIEVPFKRSFWDWLFGRQLKGVYDYEINSNEIGLNDFNNINEVSVVFEYETETGKLIETNILDTGTTTKTTTTGGGGSSGGSGTSGGGTTPICSPDKDCSYYYNLNQCGNGLSDGCSNSLNCLTCLNGTCVNGICVTLPSCIDDAGCFSIGSFCDNANNIPYNCTLGADGCFDRINRSLCIGGEVCENGQCIEIAENAIFVDHKLMNDCLTGNYSIANRDCNGDDGNAYDTIQEAATAVAAGDTVYIRAGTYNLISVIIINAKKGLPSNRITISGFQNEFVVVNGANIIPKGSTSSNSLFYIHNSSFLIVQDINFRNSVNYTDGTYGGGGIYAFRSDNLSILNNSFENLMGSGIILQGVSDSIVEFNEVSDSLVGIVMIGYFDGRPPYANSSYNRVINNLAFNNTRSPEGSDGIAVGSGGYNNIIEDNVVFGNADDGIDSDGHSPCSQNTVIRNNIVFKNGGITEEGDGNGVKVSTNCGGGHFVAGNIVFDNDRGGFDQDKEVGYPQNYFYNNIAYNNSHSGFIMDAPSLPQDEDGILYNNIATNNSVRDLYRSNDLAVNDSDYNLWGDGNFVLGMDEHSLSGDPLFNNLGLVIDTNFGAGWSIDEKLEYIRSQVREKFSLQAGSQAIDNGTIIPGYHCAVAGAHSGEGCREWYGSAPDIGAYEYEGSAVTGSVIYVDNLLATDCLSGNYNIALRACDGSDGLAFKTVWGANSIAQPGDTILIRGGNYTCVVESSLENYCHDDSAVGMITNGGLLSQPIIYNSYPGERAIFNASGKFQAFRINGAENIVVDSLDFIGARLRGILIENSKNIRIINCRAYDNKISSLGGNVIGFSVGNYSENIVFDGVESFNNGATQRGSGIGLTLGGMPGETSFGVCINCTVKNSFFYNNYFIDLGGGTTNNADGMSIYFAKNCLLENNIIWDNGEDGIDLSGGIGCRLIGNIIFRNQANGFKANVWGGGANIFQNNLAVENEVWGFTDGNGIGNLYLHNIAYRNQGIGLITDTGQLGIYANNIFFLNNLGHQMTSKNDFSQSTSQGILYSNNNLIGNISDYNLMQSLGFDANSINSDPEFLNNGLLFSDINGDDLLSPSELFSDLNNNGKFDSDDAMLFFSGYLKLSMSSPARDTGLDHNQIIQVGNDNLAQIISNAAARRDDPSPPKLAMPYTYQALIDYLNENGYPTAENKDLLKQPVSGTGWDIGAYEYSEESLPSSNPFVQIWNWIKGLLTQETGNAILTGNAVSETNETEKGNSQILYIILFLFAIVVFIIAGVIVKKKSKNNKKRKLKTKKKKR